MNISLSQAEFYILLSLALKNRHGYEIMKQVEHDSKGKVTLGPGTLYGAIKRMLQAELIAEISGDNPRRRFYTLTEQGKKALTAEIERYNDAVEFAKRNGLFNNFELTKNYRS
jgi:DNA-binding PadR family transcriptional regulator